MLALGITILRYLFLILLYLFIFRLTVSMIEQLNHAARETDKREPVQIKQAISGGTGAVLQVISPGEENIKPGQSIALGELTKIGRDPINHIVISGNYASHEHACILFKQGQYWLEDLKSLNETYLNEMPVTKPTVLAHGDRIRIGEVIFRFVRWAYEMESDN